MSWWVIILFLLIFLGVVEFLVLAALVLIVKQAVSEALCTIIKQYIESRKSFLEAIEGKFLENQRKDSRAN